MVLAEPIRSPNAKGSRIPPRMSVALKNDSGEKSTALRVAKTEGQRPNRRRFSQGGPSSSGPIEGSSLRPSKLFSDPPAGGALQVKTLPTTGTNRPFCAGGDLIPRNLCGISDSGGTRSRQASSIHFPSLAFMRRTSSFRSDQCLTRPTIPSWGTTVQSLEPECQPLAGGQGRLKAGLELRSSQSRMRVTSRSPSAPWERPDSIPQNNPYPPSLMFPFCGAGRRNALKGRKRIDMKAFRH